MAQATKNILVTGGCGFMGSHYVRFLYTHYPKYRIVNIDFLTYAGNEENLFDIVDKENGTSEGARRYEFIRGDICDVTLMANAFEKYNFELVVHFAAETHVDRSFFNFQDFIRTNIEGTRVMIDMVRKYKVPKMVHISTDEVYGNVLTGSSREDTPLKPSSPYASSKAGADMLVSTYHNVYGVPVTTVRGSNNYGSYQYPEKLIPLTITNLLEAKKVPVHGTGEHVRSWVHVDDFCNAVDLVAHNASPGSVYNVAGEHATNLDIIRKVGDLLQKNIDDYLQFVNDRPAADLRYAPQCSKIEKELGWKRTHSLSESLPEVVQWYIQNQSWWKNIKKKKEFMDHYEKQSKALWY